MSFFIKFTFLLFVFSVFFSCSDPPTTSSKPKEGVVEKVKPVCELTMEEARQIVFSKDEKTIQTILETCDEKTIAMLKKARHEYLVKSWDKKSESKPLKGFE
jgi:hypothetical protein